MTEQMILTPIPVADLRAMIGETVNAAFAAFPTPAAPQPPAPDELLTRKDAAKLLGITLPTLHKYTKARTIIAHRVGSRIRYKRSELETSLQELYTHKKTA